jgi:hypothetical protein
MSMVRATKDNKKYTQFGELGGLLSQCLLERCSRPLPLRQILLDSRARNFLMRNRCRQSHIIRTKRQLFHQHQVLGVLPQLREGFSNALWDFSVGSTGSERQLERVHKARVLACLAHRLQRRVDVRRHAKV